MSAKNRQPTRLRSYFLTGLVICAPLGITLYLTWTIVVWIDSWIVPYIPMKYHPDAYLPFSVPGFGLILGLIAITIVGFLTANLIGRSVVSYGEVMLGRMPLVRNLYNGLKQIFQTVLSDKNDSFTKVGLIEYPRKGLWAIVFIATDTKGEVQHQLDDKEVEQTVSVFLPTTPNPTSGFLLFVPQSDIVYLDMSVEEAAKLVISAGLVTPEQMRQEKKLAILDKLHAEDKEKKSAN